MYSMTIFENFEFFPTGWMVEKNALSNPRTPDKMPVTCEVYPSVFLFLICIADYFTKNNLLLLKVLQNYRTGPGLYHVVTVESYIY